MTMFAKPPVLPPPPPDPVLVSSAVLSVSERKLLWDYIQRNEPGLAAWFADPQISKLIKQQGAIAQFEPTLIQSALGPDVLARVLPQAPKAKASAPANSYHRRTAVPA